MKQFEIKLIASLLASLMTWSATCLGADKFTGVQQSEPEIIGRKSSAEYYSSVSAAKIVMPVNIWGEIQFPGIHFVPIGSTIMNTVSSAGGPSANASMPNVKLIRGTSERYVNLLKDGPKVELQSYDTIVVEQSFKTNLPLIFSTIGTLLSLATFIVVINNQKK